MGRRAGLILTAIAYFAHFSARGNICDLMIGRMPHREKNKEALQGRQCFLSEQA